MMHPTPVEFDQLPTREGYDRWAAIYDEEQNPLIAIEEPYVDALLGDVTPGMPIADIGCGTGRHALRLAARGAHITAIDFSHEMLQRGRAKANAASIGAAQICFIQHDLGTPLPLESGAFERVVCGLVLDHIRGLDELLAEMKRICASDGAIVISIMHPAMMLRGVQARFTDPQTGRETRPQSVANQICDYVMAAARAGLRLDHMNEHAVDAALATQCPRAQKYVGWPMLLMMRLRP